LRGDAERKADDQGEHNNDLFQAFHHSTCPFLY
jgi:hypothetical protein